MSAPESQAPTDALQQQPAPPLATLHYPDGIPVAPNIALPPNATVWTKLSLLLHAHQLAAKAARKVLLLRLLLLAFALSVATPIGILTGIGVFWLCFDDPYKNAKFYYDDQGRLVYYVRGQKVTLQDYDHYLANNGNERIANSVAIPIGIVTGILSGGVIWLILRPRRPTVLSSIEEQIAAIAKDHPEAVAAWGGVAVLRVPQLIEQLLDMQAKNARR